MQMLIPRNLNRNEDFLICYLRRYLRRYLRPGLVVQLPLVLLPMPVLFHLMRGRKDERDARDAR